MDLARIDRRVIFLLLLLAVALPLLTKLDLPVTVGPQTNKVFDAIEEIPEGDYIMVSFDIEASSLPEVKPLAEAMIRHAFRRDLKIIGLALFSEGTVIGYNLLSSVALEFGKEYGEDFIYLGFRAQYISAIDGMGENIRTVFPLDFLNNDWSGFEAFRSARNYGDIPLVMSISDGSLPTYWVDYAWSRYDQRIVTGLTAVMATSFYPFTASGQIIGMVAGLKGAAEYEKLLGYVGGGQRGMLAQSSAHLLIIVMVVLANVAAWRNRR